ncbi:hypothetical protein FXO38_06753 [Capsicum annuum]|nr:hypothetical protein FXO38_06753 [Capsicum annuum]KAF3673329.1 hypothetical protein FXO37_07059 [Capsicum annuum]
MHGKDSFHQGLLVTAFIEDWYLREFSKIDPDTLECYSCDLVEKPFDAYDRLWAPISNLLFGGEAVSSDYHQGSVHGAYEAEIMAGETYRRHLIKRHGSLEMVQAISYSDETLEAAFPFQISRM